MVPAEIVRCFDRANQLVGTPYEWDGGHASFGPDPGEDCSGFVSDVLHAGGVLGYPGPVSTASLIDWGLPGPGEYMTLVVINTPELAHCLLRFTLPEHPAKHLIAARHTGTLIEWYPGDPNIEQFLVQGYQERRRP